MDGLLLLITFALGWTLGGGRESQDPPVCPPVEYPAPPAALMEDPPTMYLLPPELRVLPLPDRISRSAEPTLTASSQTGLRQPSR